MKLGRAWRQKIVLSIGRIEEVVLRRVGRYGALFVVVSLAAKELFYL